MSGAAGDAAACCRRRQFAAPRRLQARRFGPCAPTDGHEPPTWASGIGDTTEPCPPTRHNPDGVRSRHPARRNPSLRGCRFQTLHNLDRGGVRCIFPAVSHLLHSPDEVRAGVQLSENLRLGTLLFSPRHNPHGVLLRHRFGETVGLHPSFARLGNFRTNSDCARLIETVVCAARMHGKTSRGPPARNRRAGGPRDAEPETCSSQGGERRTNATQPVGTTAAKRATDRKKRAV